MTKLWQILTSRYDSLRSFLRTILFRYDLLVGSIVNFAIFHLFGQVANKPGIFAFAAPHIGVRIMLVLVCIGRPHAYVRQVANFRQALSVFIFRRQTFLFSLLARFFLSLFRTHSQFLFFVPLGAKPNILL